MEIKRFETNNRTSKVVIHNNTIYLCGQVHDKGDVKEQTSEILRKIEDLLNQHNSSKNNILSSTVYLKDISTDFKEMNEVWDNWFEADTQPARTCVEAKMARECLLVEITITAAIN